MQLEKFNADYSNVPVLLEVLREGTNLCIRMYMEYSGLVDHMFPTSSGRRIDPSPPESSLSVDSLVGSILSADVLSRLVSSGEARVTEVKLRENSIAPETTIVLNSKLKELTHASFGTVTYAWIGDSIVHLDVLKASGSWKDHTLFVSHIDSSLDSVNMLRPLSNAFAEHAVSKGCLYNDLYNSGLFTLFDMWIPYKTSSIEDLIVRVYSRKFGTIGAVLTDANLSNASSNTYAPFTLSGPATIGSEKYATYVVQLTSADGSFVTANDADIYLESYSGYFPRTRISTVNGVAAFQVGALGLVAGDSIEFKMGFKNLRNLVTKKVGVI